MVTIARWSNGSIQLKDLWNMDVTDYQLLKHAVIYLQEKENETIKKGMKK